MCLLQFIANNFQTTWKTYLISNNLLLAYLPNSDFLSVQISEIGSRAVLFVYITRSDFQPVLFLQSLFNMPHVTNTSSLGSNSLSSIIKYAHQYQVI